MIHYRLQCEKGHEFDGWFAGASAFDAQSRARQIVCPDCGSARVEKSLMAPALARRVKTVPEPDTAAAGKSSVFAPDPRSAALRAAIRELRETVTANADYVGDRFAEEARKIHYKESEARGIYGEASAAEARALHDEGIEFHPLPVLPDEHN